MGNVSKRQQPDQMKKTTASIQQIHTMSDLHLNGHTFINVRATSYMNKETQIQI